LYGSSVCEYPPVTRAELVQLLNAARRSGAREAFRQFRGRFWASTTSFGLRAELRHAPPRPAAKIPVVMRPAEPREFAGFDEELTCAAGGDAVEVTQRMRLCQGGVTTLYVAQSEDGESVYAQWLVRHNEQGPLHAVTGGLFPNLEQGQALVEGAYTFIAFRKLGVMADGMHQLLTAAQAAGDECVFTYVSSANIASLRGCANAGFVPDHLRVDSWRLGRRSIERVPLTEDARQNWATAVART
jgi:hypothetical protein